MRDPLNHLSFTFKKAMEKMKTQRKNPKLLLELHDHVHPDLSVNTAFFVHSLYFILLGLWKLTIN